LSPLDYLRAILAGIVPRPSVVRIEEETAGEVTVLTVHLPQEDRRFVVGQRGRNMEAIRHLFRAYAGRHGRSLIVKLSDECSPTEVVNERQDRTTGGSYSLPGT
jgi:predicted RNA-binding protein YlqC (UPF0109 family)